MIEGDGRPVCLIPRRPTITLIDRLRSRFAMARVCVVADRRLIRVETLAELEALRLLYILACASARQRASVDYSDWR